MSESLHAFIPNIPKYSKAKTSQVIMLTFSYAYVAYAIQTKLTTVPGPGPKNITRKCRVYITGTLEYAQT